MPFDCSPIRSPPKYGEGDLFRQDDGRVHFEGAASGQDAGDEADGGEGDDHQGEDRRVQRLDAVDFVRNGALRGKGSG